MEGSNKEIPDDLTCPLCYDIFEKATLLSCGHTFCRGCLQSMNDNNKCKKDLSCPLCRKKTPLQAEKVKGLPPNISVDNLVGKFKANKLQTMPKPSERSPDTKNVQPAASAAKNVPLAAHVFRSYSSRVSPGLSHHYVVPRPRSFQIMPTDHLNPSLQMLSEVMTQQLKFQPDSQSSSTYPSSVDPEDRTQLASHQRSQSRQSQTSQLRLPGSMTEQSTGYMNTPSLSCSRRSPVPPSRRSPVPPDGKMPSACSTTSRSTMAPENRPLPAIPVGEPLEIVSEITLPGGMRGMAALSSDTVVIGYGSSIPGADSFSTAGTRKLYLDRWIGTVRDITVLNDGRLVVSHEANVTREYNSSGFPTDRHFAGKTRADVHFNICSDKVDTIYAVNGKPEINVFKMGQRSPHRVIQTGGDNPWQVCVTSDGTIICCMNLGLSLDKKNMIVAFDKDGSQGTIIKTDTVNKHLFAAVDSRDRVFIACINPTEGHFQLKMYTAVAGCLTERYKFKDVQLPPTGFIWHCLVSLSPRMIALANLNKKLYFIKIPDI